jgi:hypothetical protein
VSDGEEDDMDDEDYRKVLLPEQPLPLPFQFQELSKPKHMPPPDSSPIANFQLFFTDLILTLMLTESNRYAQQVISSKAGDVHSPLKNWPRITMHEMKGFLPCILNMGIIKKSIIASYWSTFCSQATPWFKNVFTKHRTSHLLCFFHLVKNEGLPGPEELDCDLCERYQILVNLTNTVFRHHYTPHQEISVNKSLVGTKNRTRLRQYLPNKHHHHQGTKFWVLCDCVQLLPGVFHIQKGQVLGRQGQHPKNGLEHTTVKKLLEIGGHLNKRYHVINNYFMSVPLVRHLHQLHTYITGTINSEPG